MNYDKDLEENNMAPSKEEGLKQVEEDLFSGVDKLHWGHMPITYSFSNYATERQTDLVRKAFLTIENETHNKIKFKEVQEESDIIIYFKERVWSRYEDTILGEALFKTSYLNKNLITSGEINFYGQGMVCLTGYPALEVHEILHLFGFENDPLLDKIMSEYSSDSSSKCKIKEIEKRYVECLKQIYSNESYQNNCEGIEFIESEYSCEDGWFQVEGTGYCCPKEGMIIDSKGNCAYK